MIAELEIIEEESALGETVETLPILAPLRAYSAPVTCDALYLPPCPMCSWVALWRRPSLDRLEPPAFYISRNCTARYSRPYYMLRGCVHATDISLKFGPVVNRLKVAVAWRRAAASMCATMFPRMSAEHRAEFTQRLSHPSLTPSSL